MKRVSLLIVSALLMAAAPTLESAPLAIEDVWPQWRGPNGDGVSSETGLPIVWSNESGVLWKRELPAWGDSTPAIWGDAVFVTSQLKAGELVLLRIDKNSGQTQWIQQVGIGAPRIPTSGRKANDMRRQTVIQ